MPTPKSRLAALTLALAALPAAQATTLLVPAYFYPSQDPAQSYWDELTAAAAAGVSITAIVNPGNGPGGAFNADYKTAIDSFRAAGGQVLGYVYTCYGGTQCNSAVPPVRTTADVLADAQLYAQWYGVDGVFLDEMSNTLQQLPFYDTVATGLRAAQPQWQIVGNPGTATLQDYLAVADTLVTFENGTGSYSGAPTQPWMSTAAPSRQAHLLYNVTGADAMRALLQEAQARNAGYVYITDDRYTPGNPAEPNPWDTLPSYWAAEVAAVSAVPEPSGLALALLGVAAVALRARRR